MMNNFVKTHLEKLRNYKDNLNNVRTLTHEDRFWLQHKIDKNIKFLEKELGIVRKQLTFTELRDKFKDNLE